MEGYPNIYCDVSLFFVFQIENAASLDALQECTMRHSTVLQTAGCLRRVTSVEEKKDIVADYVRWYVIDRNSSVIDRKVQFSFVFCRSTPLSTPLKKEICLKCLMACISMVLQLQKEKGKAALSVEDVLMFATGLTSLPPSGLEPLPKIEFLDGSPFPMSNTCFNLLKLPLLDSYSVFKAQMDFGIQNSPGFGCL
uniref:HECT domain-containing protein n=1 Tax=Takifugu rubripes TaxID=31033 RepID=A0A674MG39_TAKRU